MSPWRELAAELADAKELLREPSVAHPPEAIPNLEHAVQALGRLREHLEPEAAHLTPESLAKLKRDLHDVTALAGQAGNFYLGCAVILESLTRVYSSVGTPGTLPGRPSLSLEG
ncbi:MAG: hypothetical protein KIT09_24525 [Bryobacteraceae bacterium]|nr:hypothetical protein [Bryobacteraceae bacterium]